MESKGGDDDDGRTSFDESELAKTSGHLKHTKSNPRPDALDYDRDVADQYAALYDKHHGNLHEIFDALDENPRKALKHPPADATDFGIRYAQGFYTYADEK
ncbi:Aste57867_24129 [Aphanomyces stellatus]|uniref:Aste57867_24129 protein n=1 Tax=Aphanomyces stellatus TaxID=120398 RepID=A0A485LQP2_9STRA|nr:hypothetical protein As57867_024055 [Aphanomyces stellatus]VFU00771.1 Aste57867_24129 [Aphanomyces stellatus]